MEKEQLWYHFRLTEEDKQFLTNDVIVYLISISVVDLAVYEVSKIGKSHIHVILQPLKTKSTFLQQFHAHFKRRYVGNKSITCETLKKEKENNYIYLCKGTRDSPPQVLHKLSSIDTDFYWKKYWEDKPLEKDYKINPPNPNRREKVKTWSELLTIDLKKQYPGKTWEYCGYDIDILWSAVLKSLGVNSKKLNERIIKDLVLGQLNALNPDSYGLHKTMKHLAFPDLYGEAPY